MERDRRERPKGVETPRQRYGRLIKQAVGHTVALADTQTDPASPAHLAAKEGLAAVHDEFRQRCLHGNEYDGMLQAFFEDRVVTRVLGVFQDRRDEKRVVKLVETLRERKTAIAEDWPLIRTEFPGVYEEPDYDHQARLGDVPPVGDIVNFGNHAFKK